MDTKQKMAMAGSGLFAAGVGLTIVGAAMIAPAVFSWTLKVVEKGAENLISGFERTSRTVGTVAGTFQRSFHKASDAGIAEIKRSRARHSAAS